MLWRLELFELFIGMLLSIILMTFLVKRFNTSQVSIDGVAEFGLSCQAIEKELRIRIENKEEIFRGLKGGGEETIGFKCL